MANSFTFSTETLTSTGSGDLLTQTFGTGSPGLTETLATGSNNDETLTTNSAEEE